MGQRLGIAAALLGDPATLILDEPVNGLDPEGILWIRNLLRGLAAEGRTVFVSSHLMSEMALTADHLIVIGRGRLLADMPIEDFIAQASPAVVRVRSPHASGCASCSLGDGVDGRQRRAGRARGRRAQHRRDRRARGGRRARAARADAAPASLEEAFMELTRDAVEYRGRRHDARVTRRASRASEWTKLPRCARAGSRCSSRSALRGRARRCSCRG